MRTIVTMSLLVLLCVASTFAQNPHARHMERAHPTPDPEYVGEHDEPLPMVPMIMGTSRYASRFSNVNMIIAEQDPMPVQNESSIAINPLNPLNLIGSAVDYRDGSTTKAYYSKDGGGTWDNVNLGQARQGWRSSNDPSVCFDHLGRGYLCYGGFNRQGQAQFGENGVFVSLTDDGGETWVQKHIAVIIHTGQQTADSAFEDKYYVHVDTASTSPYRGRLYIPWKRVINTDSSTGIVIARSTDRGLTWLPPVAVSDRFPQTSEDTTFGQSFPLARTGPDGSVHLVWNSGTESSLRYARSTDGGATWTTPRIIQTYQPFGEKSEVAGQVNSRVKKIVRAEAYPTLTIDNTGGPRNGWLYLGWSADNEPNVYFSRSTDNGETWSTAMSPVSDRTNDQFWPWIALDPTNGDVALMYFDSRDDTANILVNCYVSYSSDGGSTWVDRRVGDAENDLRRNPFSGNTFAGDYSGCDMYAGKIYPSWVDMRYTTPTNLSDNDVFTAVVNVHAPAAPDEFSATSIPDDASAIDLSWSSVHELAFGQPLDTMTARYVLLRDGAKITELGIGTTLYRDTGLEDYREYRYTLFATTLTDSSAHRQATAFAGGSKAPGVPTLLSCRGNENGELIVRVRMPTTRFDGTTKYANLAALQVLFSEGQLRFDMDPSDTGTVKLVTCPSFGRGWYDVRVRSIDAAGNVSPVSDTLKTYAGSLSWSTEDFDEEPRFWIRSGEWARTTQFAFSSPASYTETPNGPYGRSHRDTVIILPHRLDKVPLRISWRVSAFVHESDTAFLLASTNNVHAEEQVIAWWNDSQHERWKDTSKGDDAWRWGSALLQGNVGDTLYLKLAFRSNVLNNSDGFYIDDITIDDLTTVSETSIVTGVYPQPATVYCTMGLSTDAAVSCIVRDMSGSLLDVPWYQSGHTVVLDVRSLPSGIYAVAIQQGSTITSKMITIVK